MKFNHTNPIFAAVALSLLVVGCDQAEDPAPEEEVPAEDITEEEPPMTNNTIDAPADVAAIPADATVSAEGIGIRIVTAGDGKNFPTLDHDVTVHYTGWTTDGEMFDSSVVRGEAATFPLSRLIPGWQMAIPTMSKGEKALIWIPVELAYNNRPGAPAGMLVFEIELIDISG